jgi:hypothetical protein
MVAGGISGRTICLSQEVLKSMFLAHLKTTAAIVLALAALGTGTGLYWQNAGDSKQADNLPPARADDVKPPAGKPRPTAAQVPAQAGAGGVAPRTSQPAPNPPPATTPGQPQPAQQMTASAIRYILERPIEFEWAQGPLKDFLSFLSDRNMFPVVIDTEAFKQESGMDADKQLEQKVQLEKVSGQKLGTVLQLVLAQVQADYQIRDGSVFIIPKSWVTSGRILAEPVQSAFDRLPLEKALEQLSDLTGVSVVLDVRAAEKAQVAVTAHLAHVPLKTAVRILADMADLRSVELDNVLYVTTPENARKLEAEKPPRPLTDSPKKTQEKPPKSQRDAKPR